jgi:hypothetical protein
MVEALREHLDVVRAQHRSDVEEGRGFVELPEALRRKYPSAPREWAWLWVSRSPLNASIVDMERPRKFN